MSISSWLWYQLCYIILMAPCNSSVSLCVLVLAVKRRVQAYSVVKVMLRGWKQSLVEIISGIAAITSVRFPRAHSFRLILSG